MKRFEKTKGFALGIIATLLVSSTVVPAFAATVDAAFNSIHIKINGQQVASVGQSYRLDNGMEVPFSIVCQGTTYLPLRKIDELYGKDIFWDGSTSTASINDKGFVETAPTPAKKLVPRETVSHCRDMKWEFRAVFVSHKLCGWS